MTLDTLILGGTIISGGTIRQANLGVQSGRVAALLTPDLTPTAANVIDAAGLWILPGLIDAHVHVRAPSNPDWGDFATETQAAAAGGVTTVLEMPISTPACSTAEIFVQRRELGESQAYVNFGLYAGPTRLKAREIERMADEGAIGFKIFTTDVPRGRERDFEGLCATDDYTLREALRLIKQTGLPCSVHAESADLIRHFQQTLRDRDENSPIAHSASQPPIVEALVVAKLVALARELRTRVNVAHISTRLALELVKAAQRDDIPITAETCPQYLLFDESALSRHGPYAKINPPLRQRDDQEALAAAIDEGMIAYVASDHSPFDVASKERGWKDIWSAPPGSPGVEALLHFALNWKSGKKLPVEKVLQFVTDMPARFYGLYPAKGVLEVGADADIVIVNPEADGTIHTAEWFSHTRESARLYDGLPGKGKVVQTMVGGTTVFANGNVIAPKGTGKFVRPL